MSTEQNTEELDGRTWRRLSRSAELSMTTSQMDRYVSPLMKGKDAARRNRIGGGAPTNARDAALRHRATSGMSPEVLNRALQPFSQCDGWLPVEFLAG